MIGPSPLGTAGALRFVAEKLECCFFLISGHSLFDFNWLDLIPFATRRSFAVAMALRLEADTTRFGVVELNRDEVRGLRERGGPTSGLINGGVWLISRDIIRFLPETGSLERDVLSRLAADGRVYGRAYDGFFIDMETPAFCTQAPALLASNKRRAAVFMDHDGVLNIDHGFVHKIEQFEWTAGAIEAVKLINDSGRYAFLVTNQSGVARGIYAEDQIGVLHNHVQRMLRAHGAHFDDIRCCPYHPDGTVPEYTRTSPWRKPEPGMILDLMEHWPIDLPGSMLIGDKPSDLAAAAQAGIKGHLFSGPNLLDFISPLLRT